MQKVKFEYRIALLYLIIGSLWILLSDKILELDENASAASISDLQTVKGWFYVTATALLLFIFVRKHLGKLRATETELEKHRLHLADLVNEKTAKLDSAIEQLKNANEQLLEQNKVIDQQNKDLKNALDEVRSTQAQLAHADRMAAIGILTSGIAQEIKEPLKVIDENAGFILQFLNQQNCIHTEVSHSIETIQKGTHQISTVVSGMNQLSSGQYTSHETCELHTILDNCLAILHYHLSGRIKVEKSYTDEQLLITGNPGQLHQAFISIMINAVQAISGSGTIHIYTHKDDFRSYIQIQDTGCGIDELNLAHVTDPFFTTKEPGKGSGLGLSITYTIIKNHGGDLVLESTKGEGTNVRITLPLINRL